MAGSNARAAAAFVVVALPPPPPLPRCAAGALLRVAGGCVGLCIVHGGGGAGACGCGQLRGCGWVGFERECTVYKSTLSLYKSTSYKTVEHHTCPSYPAPKHTPAPKIHHHNTTHIPDWSTDPTPIPRILPPSSIPRLHMPHQHLPIPPPRHKLTTHRIHCHAAHAALVTVQGIQGLTMYKVKHLGSHITTGKQQAPCWVKS